jgi:protein involved in polysaccharide export with SLBB domain
MGKTMIDRRSVLWMGVAGAAGCASGSIDAGEAPAAAPALADYRLGPGDRIRINVFGEDSLTGEFVIAPNGEIAYPLVGQFPAENKTITEFTDTLRTALQRYVLQPNISVEVLNYRPFFILGEVGAPGTYPYSAGLNVMNAVATAGGFSYRADTGRVFIKHANELAERQYRLTSTTPVLPGDTIRIPERRF